MTVLIFATFALALLPAILTLRNLKALVTPPLPAGVPSISILVPARDEEATIAACVEAALASVGADIEVVVLDDGSTDRTGEIVRELASRDPRVRLETAPLLPPGWAGKQHACHILSTLANNPVMLFIDADVRLDREGAARLTTALETADLVSGVPHQEMLTFSERLVIPMINAVLLGYLPVDRMREDPNPALAVACGQLIAVRREAYRACGGHGAIRTTLHDGLKLPRLFRQSGLRTDLVDGTNLATCRMYDGGPAILRGFLRNATEGMARPVALPIWTILLFGGHILPWILLAWEISTSRSYLLPVVFIACFAPIVARLLQALRCREPIASTFLHPLGVGVTLAIQWAALIRRFLGSETAWRGRAYRAQT
ncbi:hypothetical protein FHS85_004611 [Rhodoligotrophos appendicifer]|uniref:glycosyltransferase n=1 Tax=Rhodoligotrophos appendicifer TaxID=987056 RepID=UPI001186A024|nr:glycosyltransferase family 2 protein [Rhodoligotrophos appendicifer]